MTAIRDFFAAFALMFLALLVRHPVLQRVAMVLMGRSFGARGLTQQ